MAKHERYSAKQSKTGEFEKLNEKLSYDLQVKIRKVDLYPILSEEWKEMAETFGRIATITDVESKLSASKGEGTLWETEELALRQLLENSKLGISVKCLIEYKKTHILTWCNDKTEMKEPELCAKFEKGIGTVMRNAWTHVEVLQTTDIMAVMNHIGDVLQFVSDCPTVALEYLQRDDLHQRQEVVVFYYLFGIVKHLDDVKEHKVMPIIRQRGIFMNGVKALLLYNSDSEKKLLSTHIIKISEALAMICETEDFVTYKEDYYTHDDVDILLDLKSKCLSDIGKDYNVKKLIRPLMDSIDKANRLKSRKSSVNNMYK